MTSRTFRWLRARIKGLLNGATHTRLSQALTDQP